MEPWNALFDLVIPKVAYTAAMWCSGPKQTLAGRAISSSNPGIHSFISTCTLRLICHHILNTGMAKAEIGMAELLFQSSVSLSTQ
jgi:cbb3-type cytochrome oxidase subunit 1